MVLSTFLRLGSDDSFGKDAMLDPASRSEGSFAGGVPPSMLAELLRHVPGCIGVYDLAGNCVLASEALARWLDRSLADVLGRNLDQLWPEGFGEVVRGRQQMVHGGGTVQAAEEFPFRHSSKVVRVKRFAWRGPGGAVEGVVELFEEQGLPSQAEMVGRLALGIAHDFNNALTLVQCHLDTLAAELAEHRRAAGLVNDLRLVIDHSSQLPRQLIRFIQGSAVAWHPVDLNTLLTSLERLLRPRLDGVSLRLELASGGAWVEGDPVQLTQVLLNLASNALDAMPAGGQLLLRCQRLAGSGDDEAVGSGPHVRVTIRDSGVGMTAEVQRRIFDPLFTTRPNGTGLGLSVVRELVRLHGGTVTCHSVAGQGTTFAVTLPARGIRGQGGMELSAPGAAVLILDCNPDIRQLAGMILAHGRFTPVLCADFHEARQLSHVPERPLRLIVLDAELCVGRWEEDLAELLRRHPTARLLYTSAGDTVPLATPRLQARGIVLKPFRAEQLLRAVEAALSG